MQTKRSAGTILFLFLCWVSVQAQNPPAASSASRTNTPTRTITLQEAIKTALEHNLDIRIQRLNPEIAKLNLRASYSVYEPTLGLSAFHRFSKDPVPQRVDPATGLLLSGETETDTLGGQVLPSVSGLFPSGLSYGLDTSVTHRQTDLSEIYLGNWTLRLEQPLLRDMWIDGGRYQILLNKNSVKVSEYALLNQIMLTINSVEQAYYNLIFARENVRVQEAALELSERSLLETRKKVEVGSLAQLEIKQAEALAASSKADLITAQRNLALQENVLKDLLSGEYSEWHPLTLITEEKLVAVPLSFDLQESWRKGMTLRPDLQQARLDIERQNITLKYLKNQMFPALDLVGTYGHNGFNRSYRNVIDDLTRDDNPSYSYGAVLSIPLGNTGPRNRYKSSKAAKEQAVLQLKRLEQDIMVQIDDIIKLAQANYDRVQATRQAREFAEAALDAEQKKLESGKSTPFFVLQFQRNLTAARFEEIRALAEYNNALAQLAFREGSTLQRHQIDVKIK